MTEENGYTEHYDGAKITTAQQVQWQKEALDHRIAEFLRSRGWKHTCKTPGSIWLWERVAEDGRVFVCEPKTAVFIEQSRDPEEPAEDEP